VSFVEDIAAAVDALGVEAVGVVYGLGLTDWESDEKRDEFLSLLTGQWRG
jgi:hypothetical protein